MKKIVLYVVAVIVLLAATVFPYVVGMKIESEYKDLSKSPFSGVQLELVSFDRGWYESKATIDVYQFGNMGYRKLGTITQDISHGFSLTDMPFFVAAVSKDKLEIVEEDRDLLDGTFIEGKTVINLNGTASGKYRVAASLDENILWSKIPVKFSYNPKDSELDLEFKIGYIKSGEFNIENLSVKSSYMLSGLNLGSGEIKADKIEAYDVKAEGITIRSSTTFKNKVVSMDNYFAAKSFVYDANDIKNFSMDFNLKDLDPELMKSYSQNISKLEGEYIQNDGIDLLVRLLDRGGKIILKTHLEENKKPLDLQMELTTNKNGFYIASVPLTLLAKINLDLEASIHRDLIEKYQYEFAQKYLDSFIENGYFTEGRDKIVKTKIVIKDGRTLLNGKESPF